MSCTTVASTGATWSRSSSIPDGPATGLGIPLAQERSGFPASVNMGKHKPKTIRHPLALKLGVLVLAGACVVFLAAFGYGYRISRDLVLQNVRDNARSLTRSTVRS